MNVNFNGLRKWHISFGWCEVTNNINKEGHVQIKLEADELEIYEMGYGYRKYKKISKKSPISFFVNPKHLKENENLDELTDDELLFQRAVNCTIKYQEKNF